MKVVAVLGSPRLNGNSAFIAAHFLDAAKKQGAETHSFALNTLTFKGCQACRACKKTSEACVLRDDLTEVLEAVRKAEMIVLASPVYFGDVSGQMKLFIDRMYSFLTPDFHSNPKGSRLSPGKIVVFIQTQGLADTLFTDVHPRYTWVLKLIGMEEIHLLRGCDLAKPDDILKHQEVLKKAEELAAQLMGGNTPRGLC